MQVFDPNAIFCLQVLRKAVAVGLDKLNSC